MSSHQKKDLVVETLSDEAIAHYLQTHPEFFERHSQLLAGLRVPHAAGPAVSLVERQVAILRSRNAKLDRKLQELVAIARGNDALAEKIHQLACELISANSQDEVLDGVSQALQQNFGAEFTTLLIFRSDAHREDSGIMRVVDRDADVLKAFASALELKAPRCGRLTEAQRELLFGEHSSKVASAALAPLGSDNPIGLLAVGSSDADRFLPTMSVDFLTRIAALIATALASRPAHPPA